jgi:hypothetical protein
MARFIGEVEGQRGEASRLGSAASGISAHVRGWNVGVRVEGRDSDGADSFDIFATGGSNARHAPKLIGTVEVVNGCPTFIPA